MKHIKTLSCMPVVAQDQSCAKLQQLLLLFLIVPFLSKDSSKDLGSIFDKCPENDGID